MAGPRPAMTLSLYQPAYQPAKVLTFASWYSLRLARRRPGPTRRAIPPGESQDFRRAVSGDQEPEAEAGAGEPRRRDQERRQPQAVAWPAMARRGQDVAEHQEHGHV